MPKPKKRLYHPGDLMPQECGVRWHGKTRSISEGRSTELGELLFRCQCLPAGEHSVATVIQALTSCTLSLNWAPTLFCPQQWSWFTGLQAQIGLLPSVSSGLWTENELHLSFPGLQLADGISWDFSASLITEPIPIINLFLKRKVLSRVQLFATLWTVGPLSMEFSRWEYWSG